MLNPLLCKLFARLAAGTSGQVLQTGGSGANPSWTTMSSDVVKIVTATGGGANALDITSCFSATYENYFISANFQRETVRAIQSLMYKNGLRFQINIGPPQFQI